MINFALMNNFLKKIEKYKSWYKYGLRLKIRKFLYLKSQAFNKNNDNFVVEQNI